MSLTVGKLLEERDFDLRLKLVVGQAGLGRPILHTRLQRPVLLLSGVPRRSEAGRVHLLDDEELAYLRDRSPADRAQALGEVFSGLPACLIMTGGLKPPNDLEQLAEQKGIPLLISSHSLDLLSDRLAEYLQERLGEACGLHGVLVDVLGVGVLILGQSGIGKSECALDLVVRGHRLVADDVVLLKKRPPMTVYGGCSTLLQHHMEIRGLGIINIKDLYGVSAVRDRKKVELVVELAAWEEQEQVDRLGTAENSHELLGVSLPYLKIPVSPGRNSSTLVEVAARNLLLKRQGHHSAREFQARLEQVLRDNAEPRLLGEVVE